MSNANTIILHAPSGVTVALSPDEYRLVLLWLVDFEGAWEGLELATGFVVDGEAKLALIRERLRSLAAALSLPDGQIDALEMLAARYWFRQGACASPAQSSEVRDAEATL